VGLIKKFWGKNEPVSSQRTEPLTEATIREWLVARIAKVAQIQPEEVELERPFAEFGMDSMQLFELSGDLQKFLGHKVSEIVAWDYPTIAKLSEYLSSPELQVPLSADLDRAEELAGVNVSSPATEPQP
jgi:acyl carrier protein